MKGDELRETVRAGAPVLMPGVWDSLSARLAVAAGFDVVFLSGFAVSGTLLGLPDVGYLTQTEMAEAARRVSAAVPGAMVVVDADTGYGNALNVQRTVELWEAAGAAGVFIEDQVWPKRCGHMAGKQVESRQEWMAKLLAAMDAREHLFVTARTDARAVLGLDEAVERARMAADLGVDAVFVEAPESEEELAAIAGAVPGITLVANMVEAGRTPLLTADELGELGFDLIVSPLTGLFAMVRSLDETYRHLRRQGSMRDDLDRLVSFDAFTDLVELDRHLARNPDVG
ncbi:MAG: isocitrate lyase/phosphoenolpyruvate mutase family protein [Actinomycetota bacterium]|nr:isocitrate lyase/phosphoenolpyruvate mutase family protein [Actinomycetota bacterium]